MGLQRTLLPLACDDDDATVAAALGLGKIPVEGVVRPLARHAVQIDGAVDGKLAAAEALGHAVIDAMGRRGIQFVQGGAARPGR